MKVKYKGKHLFINKQGENNLELGHFNNWKSYIAPTISVTTHVVRLPNSFSKYRPLCWRSSPVYLTSTRHQYLNVWYVKQLISPSPHTPIFPSVLYHKGHKRDCHPLKTLGISPRFFSLSGPKSNELSSWNHFKFTLSSSCFSHSVPLFRAFIPTLNAHNNLLHVLILPLSLEIKSSS